MNKKLLELLVCPRCHGRLEYRARQKLLVCSRDRLAFPVRDGVPVLLEMDAREINDPVLNAPDAKSSDSSRD